MYTTLTPRLVVDDIDTAIAFYVAVFDAEPGMRIDTPDGHCVHAELAMAGLTLSLTQADGHTNPSPTQLGGTPVLLMHLTDDPDGIEARAIEHGATVIFAVDDRYYGMRDGRFRDPVGHVWMVSKTLEHLDEDELVRRTADAGGSRRR